VLLSLGPSICPTSFRLSQIDLHLNPQLPRRALFSLCRPTTTPRSYGKQTCLAFPFPFLHLSCSTQQPLPSPFFACSLKSAVSCDNSTRFQFDSPPSNQVLKGKSPIHTLNPPPALFHGGRVPVSGCVPRTLFHTEPCPSSPAFFFPPTFGSFIKMRQKPPSPLRSLPVYRFFSPDTVRLPTTSRTKFDPFSQPSGVLWSRRQQILSTCFSGAFLVNLAPLSIRILKGLPPLSPPGPP